MADNEAKPSEKAAFWNSAFWQSGWGKLVLFAVIVFFMDTDELLKQLVGPAGQAANRGARITLEEMQVIWYRLMSKVKSVFWISVTVLFTGVSLCAVGVYGHLRLVTAIGSILIIGTAIGLLLGASMGVRLVTRIAESGTKFGGTALGEILTRFGFMKTVENIPTVNLEALRNPFRGGWALIAAITLILTPITLLPYGTILAATIILAVVAFGGAVAGHLGGVDPKTTWQRISKGCKAIIVVGIVVVPLSMFLPITWEGVPERIQEFDAWLNAFSFSELNTTTILVGLFLLGVAALIISAVFHDRAGVKSGFKMTSTALFVSVPLTAILLGWIGMFSKPDMDRHYRRFMTGTEAPAIRIEDGLTLDGTVASESVFMDAPASKPTAKPAPRRQTQPVEPPADDLDIFEVLDRAQDRLK